MVSYIQGLLLFSNFNEQKNNFFISNQGKLNMAYFMASYKALKRKAMELSENSMPFNQSHDLV